MEVKWRRYNAITCSAFIIFTCCITGTGAKKLPYGSPCKTNEECHVSFGLSTDFGLDLSSITFLQGGQSGECIDSRCTCGSLNSLVFKNNNYMCKSVSSLESNCKDKFIYDGVKCRESVNVEYAENCTTPKSGQIPVCNYDKLLRCNSNGKCGCFEGDFLDKENKICLSQKAYMEKYPEEFRAELNEDCDGVSKICDKTTNMSCQSSKCKCTREFYPLETNKTCKSKESFVKEHNLTNYKVIPGVYCFDDEDCIQGLDCFKNKCACPYPCTYDNNTSSCDCGEVSSLEGATGAIIVGIIGGIVIIAFWICMIKNTLKKGTEKSRSSSHLDLTQTEPPSAVPLTDPYRNNSTTATSDASTHYNIAPAVNVPLVNPVSPPDNSTAPVGFSAPTAPPPDTTQQPPPYAPFYSSNTPVQAPGIVPPPYFPSAPGAPSVLPAYSPATQIGTSNDPPAFNIYNPIVSDFPATQMGTSNDPPANDIYKPIIS